MSTIDGSTSRFWTLSSRISPSTWPGTLMNSGTRYTSSRLASVTFIRPMSGGVKVGAVVGRHDEQRVRPRRHGSQVVDELADERVGGADLHAVELVLHAGREVVARRVGSVISSGENEVPTPVRDRTHGR